MKSGEPVLLAVAAEVAAGGLIVAAVAAVVAAVGAAAVAGYFGHSNCSTGPKLLDSVQGVLEETRVVCIIACTL